MSACRPLSLRPLPFRSTLSCPLSSATIPPSISLSFVISSRPWSACSSYFRRSTSRAISPSGTFSRPFGSPSWDVGYFLTVTGAAIFAGPVIAPAFLGLVPIVLMVIGNQRQGSLPWRSLMPPLALVLIGLVLVNGTAFTAEGLNSVKSFWVGVPLALAAVGLWVLFALANQAALAA